MRVGILGSGLMGGRLGSVFARAGHEVVFSYARSKDRLKKLAREAGNSARAGTPAGRFLTSMAWKRSSVRARPGRYVKQNNNYLTRGLVRQAIQDPATFSGMTSTPEVI